MACQAWRRVVAVLLSGAPFPTEQDENSRTDQEEKRRLNCGHGVLLQSFNGGTPASMGRIDLRHGLHERLAPAN
jgi:hypothetical protein